MMANHFLYLHHYFFRFGVGYEFKRRIAISFKAGFDYHWNYATSAFPT
tara:strand:- start:84 stop:227 length:144 start_codon:yes stop_codon:yes gene_type:complete